MAMVQRDGSGEEALNNGDGKEEVTEEEETCVETEESCAVTTEAPTVAAEEGDSSGNSNSSSSSSSGDSKTVSGEEASAEPDENGAAKKPCPPRYRYSRAELLKLRNRDLKRPDCLDPAYDNLSGMWDPERWFSGKRRGGSASPTEETAAPSTGGTAPPPSSSAGGGQQRSKRERLDSDGGGEPSGGLGAPKRRSSTDPKERLAREERDDLVLSPQRRSFGTGCHVSQPPRPSSEAASKDDSQGLLHREPTSRRIGSGRILRDQRDWDRENRDREYGYGGRRFDDSGHSSGGGGGHSNRYGDRRRGRDERIEEEEEPEWFVGGPTSQHDTIELVGFEEDPDAGNRPTRGTSSSSARRMRRNRELANRKQQNGPERRSPDQDNNKQDQQQQQQQTTVTTSSKSSAGTTNTNSVPAVSVSAASSLKKNDDRESPSTGTNCMTDTSKSSSDGPGETSTPLMSSPTLPDSVSAAPPALPTQDGFDFNDIFKPDWCPRFLSEDGMVDGDLGLSGGSRFSQWFRRESPPLDQPLVPPLDSGLLAALSGKADDDGIDHHHRRHHQQSMQRQENDLASRILASAGVTSSDGMLRVPTPDSYFTPISPALPPDRMSPSPPIREGSSKNILDILMDANINVEAHMLNGDAAKTAQLREHALSGKAKNVEELEADLKQVVLGGHNRGVQQQHHHHHHHHHEQQQQQRQQSQQVHHPLGIVPTLNLPQQQDQQHLQGLLSKLGAHQGAHGGPLVVPPSLPERALLEEDLLRAAGQAPLPQPMQHHGMVRGSGGDGMQQPPPGLLSQLLRPPAPAGKGLAMGPQQQQSNQDMLVKILAGMGPVSPGLQPPPMASHQPLSPTAQLLAARHDPMAAAAAAAMIRQQQQQEMLNSLLKPPAPPVVTTQRPSPTQQLGLLAPCPSPLPGVPQDPRRVPSPLVFGQHPSPIPPVAGPTPGAPLQSSNTLQVHSAGLRPRVPSPQELAVHTQSILQTALLKKILEDQKQKENLRKQQEAQRTRSPTATQGSAMNRGSSPSKGLSPTMAAFTPTSVMRKMHMERQDPKASDKGGSKANGEATPSDGTTRQQQQHHRINNGTVPRAPTLGRAIIKGNQAAQPPTSSDSKNPKLIQQHPPQQQAAGSLMRGTGEVDMMAKLFEQQRLIQQQQRAPPGVLGMVRQQQQGHPTIKLPGMMRTAGGMTAAPPAAPTPAAMAASRAHHGQCRAGGMKGMPGGSGRGTSVEMLQQALAQGLHPLAFQQFLLSGAAAPPAVGPFAPALHPSPAHTFVPNATGQRDIKGAGMVPGGLPLRGPAVPAAAAAAAATGVPAANLAKWFHSDVLYQPTLPPVPHQKALLVEEVERQQQQATAVKN
ncbi:uncharacterized protein LOC119160781 isoform X1 [Rhipicephalus microplus]|uniref:uncharacterized protein LOC119160781 isoform X1 n=1 Tax=Rhipicephalus microplus TaxID=6941 RepID=UPI003F6BE840